MKKAKPRFRTLLLALAAALAVTAVIGLGALRRLDRLAQDQLFQQPGVTPMRSDPNMSGYSAPNSYSAPNTYQQNSSGGIEQKKTKSGKTTYLPRKADYKIIASDGEYLTISDMTGNEMLIKKDDIPGIDYILEKKNR